ncbi:band-7 C-terminal domain-containing protein, partial [Acinetobacter baumannii]
SIQAINYFVAQRYVDAFAKLASSPQQRTVIVPADFAGLAGTLGGIGELAKSFGVVPGGAPIVQTPPPKEGRPRRDTAAPPTSDTPPPPVRP